MKSVKFYVSSAIFILLTVIKVAMPALAYEISDAIADALMLEKEHTEAVIALGESLAEMDIRDVFLKEQDTPKPIKTITTEPTEALPTPIPTPEPTVQPTPEPEKNLKLEAFLERQAKFSEYEVPENVTYKDIKIPFEYTSPVSGITSSGFGYRMHPIDNEIKYHYGTDFEANTGDKIYAFADGTIVAAGSSDSFGKYVLINHSDGYSTLYAHCSELCRGCGAVKRGELIALVGESGAATGPHLHFELKHDGIYLNPEFYI